VIFLTAARFPDGTRHGALFEALNGQKKNIVIDFKNQNGSKILKQLIKSYDVLVEGNRPGVMKRLGIGYEELQKENPRLIYCSLTGYGATGPYNRSLHFFFFDCSIKISFNRRAGHDVNYMALAGMIGLSGKPQTVPPLPGFQGADASGALQVCSSLSSFSILLIVPKAVIGIQSALIERFSTNLGQYVDISLTEAAMALAVPSLATHLASGGFERGVSSLDGGLINYNIYETKDGKYLTVGALEEHFWKNFCDHIGAKHLLPKGKELSPEQVQDATTLFQSKTLEEWIEISHQCDACLEPVLKPVELVSHPQHVARNVFIHSPPPPAASTASPSPPQLPPQILLGPRLSNHPGEYLQRARKLGEDTDEVMREDGGYTPQEIEAYRQSGVIA
jgi:crotonobetainyl-CoA:carnitine CoA-transferase CaiB-like acyl-CoA transferase